jgi:RNA polymerase sigma-70 factor (sigma-E family)
MSVGGTAPDGVRPLDADYVDFVRGRSPALLRAAFVLTGDQGLAEDLVQSALARTHLSWRRLAEAGNAEAYTRKVMYHLQVDWWRRKRFAESALADAPEMVTGDAADAVLIRVAVAVALCKLTPKQRAVVTLRYFEDQTEVETAAVLGCSVGTVKSQTAKALAKLRLLCPDLAPDRPERRQFHKGEGATR